MMAVTHAAFAVVMLYFLGDVTRENVILAAIGALLPDLDTPNSVLGRALFFISIPLNKKFGHRTITHTIYALAGVAVISFAAGISPLALGYASHLLSDMATKTGVPLLYPHNLYFVFPGNSNARVEVGSSRELLVAGFLLVMASSAAFIPSPKAMMYNLMGSESSVEFQIADLFEKNKTVEVEVRYFDGSEVVKRRFVVVGVESDREGIVLFAPETKELKKTQDMRILRITAQESKNFKLTREEIEPWEIFRRDFDVFVITLRFEHQIEGKREYKTIKEIEDLSEVVFEGKAVGVRLITGARTDEVYRVISRSEG